MTNSTVQTELTVSRHGKYLTFAMGNEEYGLEILKVREIIGYMSITPVPRVPIYIKGVINLRGQVIPVIDLRTKLGMEEFDITDQTCIIVVEVQQGSSQFTAGIIVDHVQEVLDIDSDRIEESLSFGSSVNIDMILGMAKIDNSVKILLDIDKVLGGDDINDAMSEMKQVID